MGDGVFFVGRGDLLAAIADVCVLAALRGVEAREAPGAGHVAGLADGAVGVLGLERGHLPCHDRPPRAPPPPPRSARCAEELAQSPRAFRQVVETSPGRDAPARPWFCALICLSVLSKFQPTQIYARFGPNSGLWPGVGGV